MISDPKGKKVLETKSITHMVVDFEKSKKKVTINEASVSGRKLEAISLQRISRFVNPDLGSTAMSGACEGTFMLYLVYDN